MTKDSRLLAEAYTAQMPTVSPAVMQSKVLTTPLPSQNNQETAKPSLKDWIRLPFIDTPFKARMAAVLIIELIINMKLSTEIVQSRVLEDFEKKLADYYKLCENEYMLSFRARIINGEIDPNCTNYKNICHKEAQKYKDEIKNKSLRFIKSYVNDTFDIVDDSLREEILDKDEANTVFSVLRHILIAAEMSADAETTSI